MGTDNINMIHEPYDMYGADLDFLFIPLLIFIGVMMVLSLVMYVVYSIALYRIAVSQGYDKPWLAWIPVANTFMMMILTEDDVHESLRGRFTITYGIVLAISVVIAIFVPFSSIFSSILWHYAFFVIARKYSERPGLHLLVAIVSLGIALPFQLYRFSKSHKFEDEDINIYA